MVTGERGGRKPGRNRGGGGGKEARQAGQEGPSIIIVMQSDPDRCASFAGAAVGLPIFSPLRCERFGVSVRRSARDVSREESGGGLAWEVGRAAGTQEPRAGGRSVCRAGWGRAGTGGARLGPPLATFGSLTRAAPDERK